jgi:hypothetical protein
MTNPTISWAHKFFAAQKLLLHACSTYCPCCSLLLHCFSSSLLRPAPPSRRFIVPCRSWRTLHLRAGVGCCFVPPASVAVPGNKTVSRQASALHCSMRRDQRHRQQFDGYLCFTMVHCLWCCIPDSCT